MQVDIWSDIMCPFCYIGKRNFENALNQFPHKDQISVTWHSYQLDPSIPENIQNKKSIYQYLADNKGMTLEQSRSMHTNVSAMAKAVGLNYEFDTAVVANTFSAHKLIHLAAESNLGDKAKERLLSAYFTEGKNLGDLSTLIELGNEIGLEKIKITEELASSKYAEKVNDDIALAQKLRISGVPFFVFNQKYAVSGAQPPEVFLQALIQSYEELSDKK